MHSSLIALSIIALALSSRLQADERRKSPYFIDGIHCNGLDDLVDKSDVERSYPDPEVAAIRMKTMLQNQCELIFSQHGAKNFQWMTPEDLEKLVFSLKRSKRFKAVDVHIEKSELQNHVHLVGHFTPFDPKNIYALKASGSMEGDRVASRLQGEMKFRQRGEYEPAPYALSFEYRNSKAKKALDMERTKVLDKVVTLSDEEKASLARPNGAYGALGLRLNTPDGMDRKFLEFTMKTSRLSDDEVATINGSVEIGKDFRTDPLIPASTRLSLLYATYDAKGYEVFDKAAASNNSMSKTMTFAGIAHEGLWPWGVQKIRFYRALTKELHYFGDLELEYSLSRFWDMYQAIGISGSIVRGAVLPEHRFGLLIGTNCRPMSERKNLNLQSTSVRLGLKVGLQTYTAINYLDNPYYREQAFGELSLNTQHDGFQLGIALLYGNQRLY